MLHAIGEPWSDPIVRRALIEVTLLSISAGALGCWVVFYNLSYSAESLSHALFPGLVLASLTGIPLLVGGAAGLVVAAAAIALAARVPRIGADTAVGIVVTTLLGAGVVLALSQQTPPGLQQILFGDILGVSDLDLALAAGLAAIVVAALRLLHPQLLAVGFDRSNAAALGARVGLIDLALMLLLAALILVAVQGLGNLLVVALVVGPAATARLVAHRMPSMMLVAVAFSLVAGVAGLYVSYYASTAAGATIAASIVALYLCALAAIALARRPAHSEA